jgi:hypothetical protein
MAWMSRGSGVFSDRLRFSQIVVVGGAASGNASDATLLRAGQQQAAALPPRIEALHWGQLTNGQRFELASRAERLIRHQHREEAPAPPASVSQRKPRHPPSRWSVPGDGPDSSALHERLANGGGGGGGGSSSSLSLTAEQEDEGLHSVACQLQAEVDNKTAAILSLQV